MLIFVCTLYWWNEASMCKVPTVWALELLLFGPFCPQPLSIFFMHNFWRKGCLSSVVKRFNNYELSDAEDRRSSCHYGHSCRLTGSLSKNDLALFEWVQKRPWRRLEGWSTSSRGTGWESRACSAWRREGRLRTSERHYNIFQYLKGS